MRYAITVYVEADNSLDVQLAKAYISTSASLPVSTTGKLAMSGVKVTDVAWRLLDEPSLLPATAGDDWSATWKPPAHTKETT